MTYHDRDSPVEYTGRADLVTAGCSVCRESQTVAESTAAAGFTCAACRVAVHELALIERDFRESDCEAVRVRLSSDGARLGFATGEFNEHYRGRVTARVCRAVCATARWTLAVIHDTIEDPQDGSVHSLLTVRRADR